MRILADPSEAKVLVMSIDQNVIVNNEIARKLLLEVGLLHRVESDMDSWQVLDSVIAIPWQVVEN